MEQNNIGAIGGWVIFASGIALVAVGALAARGMVGNPDIGSRL